MKITLEEFKNQVEQLDKEIIYYYEGMGDIISDDEDECKQILSDGIVNIKEYFESPLKILWILKEPHDVENDGAGGWPVTGLFNREWMLKKKRSNGTWYPIIYTSYAILNNDIACYETMPDIPDESSIIDVLQKIAFINVSKFAGGTTSNNREISKAYQKHKKILLKQIEVFNPDVIIGGNTIHNFIDDLGLKDVPEEYDEYNYWRKDGKIYIAADHPRRKIGRDWEEEYTDSILNIIRKNLKK